MSRRQQSLNLPPYHHPLFLWKQLSRKFNGNAIREQSPNDINYIVSCVLFSDGVRSGH